MSESTNTYPFKTKPYEHQLNVFNESRRFKNYALFTEMGTGKSKMLIDQMCFWWHDNAIDAVAIVAPKGVYANWHNVELPKHMWENTPYVSALWTSTPRAADKKRMGEVFSPIKDHRGYLRIFIINVEALSTKKGQDALFTFLRRFPDRVAMLIDESTTIKNPKAKRTKAVVSLGKYARIKRIATGSPITRNPLDLFTQCQFLDPKLLGFTSFYSFRNRYAVLRDINLGGRSFKKIVGFKNLEELQERLKKFSIRLTKKECLDLPEKIYTTRTIELTKEQKHYYQQMKDECMIQFESGEITTAQNALTQILRLHQVVCGSINGVDIKNDRIKNLIEVLEETDGKVIIWANYRENIHSIMEAIIEAFGNKSAVSYYGDTTADERKRAVAEFQDPRSEVRFFVGNAQTGGYGLTLTEASTVIYYSNSYNLEHRLQSEDRAHRIGQRNPVTYIDFVSPGTIDEKIIKALKEKKSIADLVIDNWREIIDG